MAAEQLAADSVAGAEVHEAEVQVEPVATASGEIVGNEKDREQNQGRDQGSEKESEKDIDSELDLGFTWG